MEESGEWMNLICGERVCLAWEFAAATCGTLDPPLVPRLLSKADKPKALVVLLLPDQTAHIYSVVEQEVRCCSVSVDIS